MVINPVGFGTKNHCADPRQQQFSNQAVTPTSSLVEERATLLKHVHVQERTNILVIDLDET
jgi:hypothetical protein